MYVYISNVYRVTTYCIRYSRLSTLAISLRRSIRIEKYTASKENVLNYFFSSISLHIYLLILTFSGSLTKKKGKGQKKKFAFANKYNYVFPTSFIIFLECSFFYFYFKSIA